MKWITRECPKIDRIACPWLVARFVDKSPEFLYVPGGEVMRLAAETGAIPYDVPGVELGHRGDRCSFDAFIDKYKLDDAALDKLALNVCSVLSSKSSFALICWSHDVLALNVANPPRRLLIEGVMP